jgi:hypothetical protein
MRGSIHNAVSAAVVGGLLGPSITILLTILTTIIPIGKTIDLVLLLGFAPGAYLGLLCLSATVFAFLGFLIGLISPWLRGIAK